MPPTTNITELLKKTGIIISSELEDRFLIEYQRVNFYILKTDVDEYLRIKDIAVTDPKTSIFFPGYYEQLIEIQDRLESFRLFNRNEESADLSNQDNSLNLKISPISTIYLLHLTQSTEFRAFSRRAISSSSSMRYRMRTNDANPLPWKEAFRRFPTVKIITSVDSSYRAKKEKLYQIAEAALFHFAYGTGVGLNLSRSWERTFYRLSQRREKNIQFPKRIYDSDLVSYYQLALSSESLMLGYIALYKILEHFFSSASEKVLHTRLTEKLIQPDFSYIKPTQLRELAALVRKHDQRMDESRMLASVIEQYFSSDEIMVWVKNHENESGQYYTVPQTIFAEPLTLDLNPDKLFSSLAKRIYHIRNVLVHNKEGDLPRFVPFSGQEAILSREIPIVLFLAEQLILKTGKDI